MEEKEASAVGFHLAGEDRDEAWDRAVQLGAKANKSHLSQ